MVIPMEKPVGGNSHVGHHAQTTPKIKLRIPAIIPTRPMTTCHDFALPLQLDGVIIAFKIQAM
jgi:hypothetical protein